MKSTFRALRSPNYRLYFSGQVISMVGTWMQSTVQAWLVFKMSHSAMWLGIVSFCGQFPAFLVSPMAGFFADNRDRRKMLMTTESVAMVQAILMAVLVFTHSIQIWHIAVLSAVLGLAGAFEITTRHAFAVDMVGKSDLSSAIALNSVAINGSRMVGPALGGVLIAWIGEGGCFLLNAISYIAVLYGLAVMTFPERKPARAHAREAFAHIGAGVRYVRKDSQILGLMAITVFVTFFGLSYLVLLPVFAKDILHGDAETLGWLTGVIGVGSVLGALLIAGVDARGARLRHWISASMVSAGLALLILGASGRFEIASLALFMIGFSMMSCFPLINNAIQQRVDDAFRGRVLSLYTMSFLGAMPLAGLLAGFCSDLVGPKNVARAGGLLCFVLAFSVGRSSLQGTTGFHELHSVPGADKFGR